MHYKTNFSSVTFVAIGLLGIGAVLLRFFFSLKINRKMGFAFPFGTLMVNLSGCFLAGFLAAMPFLSQTTMYILSTGFLSTYTTFSTLILETENFILIKKKHAMAVFNLVLHIAGGILLFYVGYYISREIWH